MSGNSRRIKVFWMLTAAAAMLAPPTLSAQSFYYHTVHASSIQASYGRTYKAQYTHQLSHRKQMTLSGNYVFDEYDQGRNHIKTDIYTVALRLQHNLIRLKSLFLNVNLGVSGYALTAEDVLGLTHKERKLNFVGGVQLELYLWESSLAIVGDFDLLYMPFSDIYEYLRVPSGGIALYF